MLAPEVAQRARDSANCHVRLKVVSVPTPTAFPGGDCRIETRVERVFRSSVLVSVGEQIVLRVYCYVPPDSSPTGPAWLDFSRLKPSTVLEAFLNKAKDGSFEVAMYQVAFSSHTGQEPDAALWVSPAAAGESGPGALDQSAPAVDTLVAWAARSKLSWLLGAAFALMGLTLVLVPVSPTASQPWLQPALGTWGVMSAIACFAPRKLGWLFRVMAATVLLLYLAYLFDMLVEQTQGPEGLAGLKLPASRAESNAWNALRGLIAFGIPSLSYTLFGNFRFRRRRTPTKR